MTFEILEADAMTAPPDQWIQRTQGFGGNVLEDKKTGHLQTMPKLARGRLMAGQHVAMVFVLIARRGGQVL
jgi:hypothetical protein